MRPARFRNAVIAAVAVVATAAPTAARSAGVEEFYKGRTISLIVEQLIEENWVL